MPRRSIPSILPSGVLMELHQRLKDSDYGQFLEHCQWLKEMGFSVSKSSIHRYAQEVRAGNPGDPGDGDISVELRMRCLEVAARFASAEKDLVPLADKLYFYATVGRT